MPTFVIQARLSADFARGLVAKPEDRTDAVAKLVAACGGKMKDYYITTGEHDVLVIIDAPEGSDVVAASLVTAAAGAVSDVTTSRAWTPKEFKKIAQKAHKAMAAYRTPG